MAQQTEVRPDTSDMLAVHQVFRDAFGAAAEHVASAGSGADPARVELVGDFYRNVFAFLHVHHEAEDALVTPLLVARVDDPRDVERVAAQHTEVLAPLADAEDALDAWSESPGPATSAAFVASVGGLDEVLRAHLEEEERVVLPLCDEHLSVEEWGAMPGHAMAAFQGDRIWLVLGLIREQMTDEQRAQMLANMPPPAVEMWTTFGNDAFDGFVTELRTA
jgi:hemerythrin-like domain-containing protein